jgi:hypothetical protein
VLGFRPVMIGIWFSLTTVGYLLIGWAAASVAAVIVITVAVIFWQIWLWWFAGKDEPPRVVPGDDRIGGAGRPGA